MGRENRINKPTKNGLTHGLIILNDIISDEIGFNSDYNEVHFITQEKTEKIDKNSKQIIAEKIIKKVTKYFF